MIPVSTVMIPPIPHVFHLITLSCLENLSLIPLECTYCCQTPHEAMDVNTVRFQRLGCVQGMGVPVHLVQDCPWSQLYLLLLLYHLPASSPWAHSGPPRATCWHCCFLLGAHLFKCVCSLLGVLVFSSLSPILSLGLSSEVTPEKSPLILLRRPTNVDLEVTYFNTLKLLDCMTVVHYFVVLSPFACTMIH